MNRELLDVIPTLPPVTEEDAKDKEPKEIKHLLKERAAKAYEEKEAPVSYTHLRIQSREYVKRISDTETEKRIAYEVSVSKLEKTLIDSACI